MPIHRQNLQDIVDAAWRAARQPPQQNKRRRSEAWVNALAMQFQAYYPRTTGHRVFWKDSKCNQTHFRLNEFLFDIAVCSVSTTLSLERQPRELEFISDCHWLVESEFRRNTRAIVVDMSKLVVGSAENKLFVAAHRPGAGERAVLDRCTPIAERCRANVFFLFVSHPEDWGTARELNPSLHEWTASNWRELGFNPLLTVAVACRRRRSAPGARSGGCGQADPAAVQRRIPVADPRGSRPLHPARRDRPSAASRGLVQLAFIRLAQGAPQRFAQGPDTEKTRRQAGRAQSSKWQGPPARSEGGAPGEGTGHRAHDSGRAGKVAGLLGLNLNDGKNC